MDSHPLTFSSRDIPYLVLGGGIAGAMLALKLAQKGRVILLLKGTWQDSNTWYAQGGIASVLDADDSFAEHIQDTLVAGADLCHPEIVRLVVEGGPKAIKELVQYGVKFTQSTTQGAGGEHAFHLTREGGHSRRRVIHALDVTGREVVLALMAQVQAEPAIEVWENTCAVDLITTDKCTPSFEENRCLGAYVWKKDQTNIARVVAQHTFLCTGGHGKVYLYTSNPDHATGDGVAMASRAGCRVANLEFMQFHPTCLYHPKAKNFLISEAVRGEGAVLTDFQGRPFMQKYHPLASLAPRDIVARAIDQELKRTGHPHAYLDCSNMRDSFERLFPNILGTCLEYGIDPRIDPIPVVPAAYYSCGGIVVNAWGQTDIPGLWALGENACTGLHGANRLASNSLLEAAVFAQRVADKVSITYSPTASPSSIPEWDQGAAVGHDELVVLSQLWDEIRRLMWNYVGIVRTNKRLSRALSRIEVIRRELDVYYWGHEVTKEVIEVRNLAQVAWLTIRCAMSRKESRGIHFTLDYPNQNTMSPAKDTIVR